MVFGWRATKHRVPHQFDLRILSLAIPAGNILLPPGTAVSVRWKVGKKHSGCTSINSLVPTPDGGSFVSWPQSQGENEFVFTSKLHQDRHNEAMYDAKWMDLRLQAIFIDGISFSAKSSIDVAESAGPDAIPLAPDDPIPLAGFMDTNQAVANTRWRSHTYSVNFGANSYLGRPCMLTILLRSRPLIDNPTMAAAVVPIAQTQPTGVSSAAYPSAGTAAFNRPRYGALQQQQQVMSDLGPSPPMENGAASPVFLARSAQPSLSVEPAQAASGRRFSIAEESRIRKVEEEIARSSPSPSSAQLAAQIQEAEQMQQQRQQQHPAVHISPDYRFPGSSASASMINSDEIREERIMQRVESRLDQVQVGLHHTMRTDLDRLRTDLRGDVQGIQSQLQVIAALATQQQQQQPVPSAAGPSDQQQQQQQVYEQQQQQLYEQQQVYEQQKQQQQLYEQQRQSSAPVYQFQSQGISVVSPLVESNPSPVPASMASPSISMKQMEIQQQVQSKNGSRSSAALDSTEDIFSAIGISLPPGSKWVSETSASSSSLPSSASSSILRRSSGGSSAEESQDFSFQSIASPRMRPSVSISSPIPSLPAVSEELAQNLDRIHNENTALKMEMQNMRNEMHIVQAQHEEEKRRMNYQTSNLESELDQMTAMVERSGQMSADNLRLRSELQNAEAQVMELQRELQTTAAQQQGGDLQVQEWMENAELQRREIEATLHAVQQENLALKMQLQNLQNELDVAVRNLRLQGSPQMASPSDAAAASPPSAAAGIAAYSRRMSAANGGGTPSLHSFTIPRMTSPSMMAPSSGAAVSPAVFRPSPLLPPFTPSQRKSSTSASAAEDSPFMRAVRNRQASMSSVASFGSGSGSWNSPAMMMASTGAASATMAQLRSNSIVGSPAASSPVVQRALLEPRRPYYDPKGKSVPAKMLLRAIADRRSFYQNGDGLLLSHILNGFTVAFRRNPSDQDHVVLTMATNLHLINELVQKHPDFTEYLPKSMGTLDARRLLADVGLNPVDFSLPPSTSMQTMQSNSPFMNMNRGGSMMYSPMSISMPSPMPADYSASEALLSATQEIESGAGGSAFEAPQMMRAASLSSSSPSMNSSIVPSNIHEVRIRVFMERLYRSLCRAYVLTLRNLRIQLDPTLHNMLSQVTSSGDQIFVSSPTAKGRVTVTQPSFVSPLVASSPTVSMSPSVNGTSIASPAAAVVLASFVEKLQNNRLPSFFISQTVQRALVHMEALLFNEMCTHPHLCTYSNGLNIQLRLAAIEEFLQREGLGELRSSLDRLREAANLLSCPDKNVLANPSFTTKLFPSLTASQVYFLLNSYAANPKDPRDLKKLKQSTLDAAAIQGKEMSRRRLSVSLGHEQPALLPGSPAVMGNSPFLPSFEGAFEIPAPIITVE